MAGKSFRFPLQTVLTLREREAEAAAAALGEAARARRAQEEHLEATRARRAAAAVVPTGRLAPADLRRQAGFLTDLRLAEREAERDLGQLARREEEARRTLSEKRRPELALRTLRDAQHEAFRAAEESAERRLLDEQAVARYARRAAS